MSPMLNRRTLLLTPFAAAMARAAAAQTAPAGRMLLAMHQNTSRAAGFRGSLEGWARAGVRYVELGERRCWRTSCGPTRCRPRAACWKTST